MKKTCLFLAILCYTVAAMADEVLITNTPSTGIVPARGHVEVTQVFRNITLTAVPDSSFEFLYWIKTDGADVDQDFGLVTTNPYSFVHPQDESSDVTLRAVFARTQDLQNEGGTVTIEPDYDNWPFFDLTAEAGGCSEFQEWRYKTKNGTEDEYYDNSNVANVTMDRYYIAKFTIANELLTKEVERTHGHIDLLLQNCQFILTAVPDENYVFAKWKDDESITSNVRTMSYEEHEEVTAYFKEKTYDVDLYDNNASATQEVLTAKQGKTVNATLHRTLYCDGYYNTLCLPFSLSTLEGTPLEGGTLMTYTGSDLYENTVDVHIEEATSIDAGKPYLIMFPEGDNIVNPVFNDVVLTEQTPTSVAGTGMSFEPTFVPQQLPSSEDYLFVGANNVLYWPSATSNPIKGFRAYFEVSAQSSPVRRGMPAQFVVGHRTPTDLEQAQAEGQVLKYIDQDALVIMRNGVRYDAFGRQLKK